MVDYSWIILIVAMFAMLYFFSIRPENKRKKEAENLRNSLKVGDVITTIGGITGTICGVKENTVVFETGADRVRIEVTKWAVSTKDQPGAVEQPAKSAKDSKDSKAVKETKEPKELKGTDEAKETKDAKEPEK